MRKQYQWVALILFTAVFFCTNRDNNLKACGTNTTACAPVKKTVVNALQKDVKHVKKISVDYAEEENGSLYIFTDPFIHSNNKK